MGPYASPVSSGVTLLKRGSTGSTFTTTVDTTGPSGVSLTYLDGSGAVQTYLSTTPSAVTGGSWSTTVPAWSSGKYYWQRLRITSLDRAGDRVAGLRFCGHAISVKNSRHRARDS